MIIDVIKVMLPATLAFFVGIAITPLLTHYLYKYKAWKKNSGKKAIGGGDTPIFDSLHAEDEKRTPRLGGIVIWVSAFITIVGIWLVSKIFPGETIEKLDFLSRNQTWIPLFTLMVGSLVGLIDDLLEITGKGKYFSGGLPLSKRLMVITVVSGFVSYWFYYKLDVSTIGFPFLENIELGLFFIPFFILVTLLIYAGGVIDGIDGLSGGVFASMFIAYSAIAFYQEQFNLAAFSAAIVGGLFAFLWYNVPPARFYMSETGTMGLTLTLTVVAFMTDSLGGGHGVIVLPIIAFLLLITVASNIIQVLSKKIRGKKVFMIAPLHHHFEAIGWPSYKVTMRYWIVGIITSLIGVIVALIG